MNRLEKPKLKFSALDKIGTLFGIVCSIFANKYFGTKISIITFLFIAVIVLVYILYDYCKSVDKFYKDYSNFENKFNSLENRYNQRTQEIKTKDNLIEGNETFITNLDIFIMTALTQNSQKEINQLENIKRMLYIAVEHLAKMKGEL